MSSRPIFNVLVPFDGNTTVQMNLQMAEEISRFIFEFDEIDDEIYVLAGLLKDPGSWYRKANNVAFSVDVFGSMVNLNMNQEMLEIFVSYLEELENDGNSTILKALMHALKDPIRAYEIYLKKYMERSKKSRDDRDHRHKEHRDNRDYRSRDRDDRERDYDHAYA